MTPAFEALLAKAELLLATRQLRSAISSFDQAEHLGADPDHCAGRRWTCHMLAGNYELAWQQSDAIRARAAADEHRVWDGTPLTGQRVMVRSVHGLGDAIQMLRYAPLIRRQASRLTLQLAPPLIELARSITAIDEVLPWAEESPYDVQLEITELPYIFRSTPATLPATIPYLYPSATQTKEAQSILGATSNTRIGLVWSSSAWDTTRSLPFHLLHPLLEARDDLDFWCMQPDSTEWNDYCYKSNRPPRRAGNYSVATFAACMAQMDLVITTDSFAAHIAGALGKPAWVLLKQQADWRWMIERADSPWYPTLRLFRQPTEGNWQALISLVTRGLLTWIPNTPISKSNPPLIPLTSGGL
jgi:hypothetical protein